MKRLTLLIVIGLCAQLCLYNSGQAAPESSVHVKELNFVFLHGAGGNPCALQLLTDSIVDQLPQYILDYEQVYPDTRIHVNTLNRCYPNDVDIHTWAENIADSINEHFQDKKNIILIGHSMGGKAALYAVAQNIGDLADKVLMVVTINSPIGSLNDYYVAGGGSAYDYCRLRWLLSNQGICGSVAYYDSAQDGRWVGYNKHWLAFISAEATPSSVQFDVAGVDPLPRDMDDGLIPLSAQYSDGADVIYYGEHGHSDFVVLDEVAEVMAEQILRYLFGGPVEYSVFARGGTLEHKARWLPGKDYWEDIVGGILVSSGSLWHTNNSLVKWQEWEDVVGGCFTEDERCSYQVSLVKPFPFLISIKESRWLSTDDTGDFRLYLRTGAAPRNQIQVDWSIYRQGLLPEGFERSHYEVEIITGTPLTNIGYVAWAADDSRDLRLQILSEAERPFRWFQAEWRVYAKETIEKRVIDEISGQELIELTSGELKDSD